MAIMLIGVLSPLAEYTDPSGRVVTIGMNRALADYYAGLVVKMGHYPVVPHLLLSLHLDDTDPAQRAQGMALGAKAFSKCDELWIFGDRFSGGMGEDVLDGLAIGQQIVYVRETSGGVICLADRTAPFSIQQPLLEGKAYIVHEPLVGILDSGLATVREILTLRHPDDSETRIGSLSVPAFEQLAAGGASGSVV